MINVKLQQSRNTMATITNVKNQVATAVKPDTAAKSAKSDPVIVAAVAAINESIVNTPLSVKLANILGMAKQGSDRYIVAGRKTPVIAGVLAVYNTSVYDATAKVYFDIVAVKPLSGGRAIVLGQMGDRGLDLCPQVKLNSDIVSAVARANSSWAEILKAEAKETRLNLKLDAIAEYFNSDNGAFVDL